MLKLKDPGLFKQQVYLAGTWVDADDGGTVAVTNPANGETLGTRADVRHGRNRARHRRRRRGPARLGATCRPRSARPCCASSTT